MPITIAQGSPQSLWVPIKDEEVIYVGGLVCVDRDGPAEGVEMLPVALGIANVDNNDVPYGVVIGTNLKNSLFSTTYKCEYITGQTATDPHDGSTTEYVGVEGPYGKGDQIAMAKIALITPDTVLKASLFVTDAGTPPTERTVTAGDTDGTGCTVAASDFAPVAHPLQTVYFRKGANAGTYRMVDQANSTALEWDTACVYDTVAGDVLVMVPVRTHGFSTVYFSPTTMSFIDTAVVPLKSSDAKWTINVVRLDLREQGKEFVEFLFDISHFGHSIKSD